MEEETYEQKIKKLNETLEEIYKDLEAASNAETIRDLFEKSVKTLRTKEALVLDNLHFTEEEKSNLRMAFKSDYPL